MTGQNFELCISIMQDEDPTIIKSKSMIDEHAFVSTAKLWNNLTSYPTLLSSLTDFSMVMYI